MEITIKETKTVERTINVELPYYYKHDLCLDHCDSVIYGKIIESSCTSIQITREYNTEDTQYELAIEKGSLEGRFTSCFEPKYKSSEAEFLATRSKMIEALNNA